MDKRKITHGLLVIAIVVSVFIAAAFTPVDTYKATGETVTVTNLAKVDFENRTMASDIKMIADNDIPLATTPFETGNHYSLWIIALGVVIVITGVVIYEGYLDRITKQIS